MSPFNRRNFIKKSGAALLPSLIPAGAALAAGVKGQTPDPKGRPVIFYGDGEMLEPSDYLEVLKKVNAQSAIMKDRYGVGGVVEALEKRFAAITGKERAIYMPSGTLANQLAVAVLSGDKAKVIVQDASHIFRDEADAAQSVFQKRLVPLAKGRTFFTAEELKEAMEGLQGEEAFPTAIGAVSVENPVRRATGRMVPLAELRKISEYCRSKGIKLHLDGARLYMASAWSGVSIKEYASLFDTVYISLYKYLGASGGAVLCGDKSVIDKMPHLIKVHGGSQYGNWLNAAMALHRLEGFEARLAEARKRADEIFAGLHTLGGFTVSPLEGGTNIYSLQLPRKVNGKELQARLAKDFAIRIGGPNAEGQVLLTVNETLLNQPPSYIIDAFRKSV